MKIVLFWAYCTPLYAVHLWNKFNKSTFRRIKVAYDDAYRILFNLPRYASARTHQVENNVVTFDALLRNLLFLFVRRCQNSQNVRIANLMFSSAFYKSPFHVHFEKLLH